MRCALVIALAACGGGEAVRWATDERAAFERARAEGKDVLVLATASWSIPDEELVHHLGDRAVRAALAPRAVVLRRDVSDGTSADDAFRRRYRMSTWPGAVLVDTDGNVLARIEGVRDPDELVALFER